MIDLSIGEVADVLGAQIKGDVGLVTTLAFPSVSIDSRTIQKGECFIAFEGERFNGHNFIDEALEKGASVVVLSQNSAVHSNWQDRLFLEVNDTEIALQALAHYVRRKWGKSLAAISGSVGKTTTREFIKTLLERRFHVIQSPGNLNNKVGVPLSLLQISPAHEIAILELGMSRPGEIRILTHMCAPDTALLTNVATVHAEFFSGLDEIASAKGEILEGLSSTGKFFFNIDDPLLRSLASSFSGDKISFGLDNPCDFRISNYDFKDLDKMSFDIEFESDRLRATAYFMGRHFLYNIVAAVAVCVNFGLSHEEIVEGISRLKVPLMRGQIFKFSRGNEGLITVWDDSYNSSPLALNTVLETVAELHGFRRKVLALGEMLELGSQSSELHRQAGHAVARCRADDLVTVGSGGIYIGQGAKEKGFPAERIIHFESSQEAAEFLIGELHPGEFLLVKGSRGVGMDRVVRRLKERGEN
ncbi:MAG: UDP-N-acetylmuramoyl-tripeptide--D-alanyl-D-alanine ligase [Acidobacteriota bacterium]|nr:UDP-N-acetylmuramoyl-tripeptide--D-alanyl-D-alanine ligase [Acidobacteriota bacterium]